MKSSENEKKADYLLLHTIIGKYLERCVDKSAAAPRYLQLESIDEIVEPFYEIKSLIQRVEWLEEEEYMMELINFMAVNKMSVEELSWAVDMFAVEKQIVFDKIRKSAQIYE